VLAMSCKTFHYLCPIITVVVLFVVNLIIHKKSTLFISVLSSIENSFVFLVYLFRLLLNEKHASKSVFFSL